MQSQPSSWVEKITEHFFKWPSSLVTEKLPSTWEKNIKENEPRKMTQQTEPNIWVKKITEHFFKWPSSLVTEKLPSTWEKNIKENEPSKMTQQTESNIWVKKITQHFLEGRETPKHLGKDIKNNPIKWPNRLNPAFFRVYILYTVYTFMCNVLKIHICC